MKQAIIIPEKICPGVFNLPCVRAVEKHDLTGVLNRPCVSICYSLYKEYFPKEIEQTLFALPGDTLIEEDNGKWRVKREGEEEP